MRLIDERTPDGSRRFASLSRISGRNAGDSLDGHGNLITDNDFNADAAGPGVHPVVAAATTLAPRSSRLIHRTKTLDWKTVRDHVSRLNGATIVNFMERKMAVEWLDFSYCGRRILIRGRVRRLHFYVDDPLCPDTILYRVGRHFEKLAEIGSG